MTIHLPEALESFLHSRVSRGAYPSIDEAFADAMRRLMRDVAATEPGEGLSAPETGTSPAHEPIWEEFEEISRTIPPEVWDELPTDLSEQHDHYIYGGPKRATE